MPVAGKWSKTKQVKVLKSISFGYAASKELSALFEDFRLMCNDAIRIAVEKRPKNRLMLIAFAYARLKEYHLHTHYVLSACEIAFSVYRNEKRKSTPYVRSPFIKLDNQSYQLNHLLLRIPTTPKNFVFLTLRGSEYHQSFVDDPRLKRGSVIINPSSVIIAFTKEAESFEPMGFIGIDLNERNVTVSGTDGWYKQFNELGDVAEIKERYRVLRASISGATAKDRRTAKELLTKYGRRERNRTESRLHKITTQIVGCARDNKMGIKMERLTGIRRYYGRGNRQGSSYRGRMNTWVFGETQRQADYKSRWEGVPLWYVDPRGTSSYCLCGSRVAHLADRQLYCPGCDRIWDRDDLASRNIMACAVPQARSSKGSGEGERKDDISNPRSRWRKGKTAG